MLAEIDSGYLHSDRGQNVVFEDYGVGFVTFEEHIYPTYMKASEETRHPPHSPSPTRR